MSTRYVRHMSGQGEKWPLTNQQTPLIKFWSVYDPAPNAGECFLFPKSEYVLCEPPEHWVDVTAEVEVKPNSHACPDRMNLFHGKQPLIIGSPDHIVVGYRLRKVKVCLAEKHVSSDWAFIVERKEP